MTPLSFRSHLFFDRRKIPANLFFLRDARGSSFSRFLISLSSLLFSSHNPHTYYLASQRFRQRSLSRLFFRSQLYTLVFTTSLLRETMRSFSSTVLALTGTLIRSTTSQETSTDIAFSGQHSSLSRSLKVTIYPLIQSRRPHHSPLPPLSISSLAVLRHSTRQRQH